MTHFDILLPFALPPAELAGDLLRSLDAPALAMLLSRAQRRDERFDAFSRSLPHEIWLARQFGLEDRLKTGGSPPVAAAAMQSLGLEREPGTWFMLQPTHLHIARDHLVLTDLRQLMLFEPESRALFDAAAPLLMESGATLRYGDAHAWFLRADGWEALQTSTPDAACGHNIDIWMPKGAGERDWRKLQNEIQMVWHTHAVNAEREARRQNPVNSLWLWGGTPHHTDPAPSRYAELINPTLWSGAPARFAARRRQAADAAQAFSSASGPSLVLLDGLIAPALANDWSGWLAQMHALEAAWFAPLLEALKAGKISAVSLILTHGSHLSEFSANRHALRKFWLKPSLTKLTT